MQEYLRSKSEELLHKYYIHLNTNARSLKEAEEQLEFRNNFLRIIMLGLCEHEKQLIINKK